MMVAAANAPFAPRPPAHPPLRVNHPVSSGTLGVPSVAGVPALGTTTEIAAAKPLVTLVQVHDGIAMFGSGRFAPLALAPSGAGAALALQQTSVQVKLRSPGSSGIVSQMLNLEHGLRF